MSNQDITALLFICWLFLASTLFCEYLERAAKRVMGGDIK